MARGNMINYDTSMYSVFSTFYKYIYMYRYDLIVSTRADNQIICEIILKMCIDQNGLENPGLFDPGICIWKKGFRF